MGVRWAALFGSPLALLRACSHTFAELLEIAGRCTCLAASTRGNVLDRRIESFAQYTYVRITGNAFLGLPLAPFVRRTALLRRRLQVRRFLDANFDAHGAGEMSGQRRFERVEVAPLGELLELGRDDQGQPSIVGRSQGAVAGEFARQSADFERIDGSRPVGG